MIDYVSIPAVRMKKLMSSRNLVRKLEDLGDVKISFDKDVSIESDDSIKVMNAKEVIKAFGRGFDFEDALYLLDDSYVFCVINIKDFSGKSVSRLNELRGRVIGKKGKTKDIIEKIADVKLSIYGKTVSIVGRWDSINLVREAICMLLEGRKHGTVYRFLEDNVKPM